jgi:hypothetical protein
MKSKTVNIGKIGTDGQPFVRDKTAKAGRLSNPEAAKGQEAPYRDSADR